MRKVLVLKAAHFIELFHSLYPLQSKAFFLQSILKSFIHFDFWYSGKIEECVPKHKLLLMAMRFNTTKKMA